MRTCEGDWSRKIDPSWAGLSGAGGAATGPNGCSSAVCLLESHGSRKTIKRRRPALHTPPQPPATVSALPPPPGASRHGWDAPPDTAGGVIFPRAQPNSPASARSSRRACKTAAPPCSDRPARPAGALIPPHRRPTPRHFSLPSASPPTQLTHPTHPSTKAARQRPSSSTLPSSGSRFPLLDSHCVEQRIKAVEQGGCNGAGSVLHPFGWDGPAGGRGACRVFRAGAPIIEGTLARALL